MVKKTESKPAEKKVKEVKSTEKKLPYYIFPPLLLIVITVFFYYDSLQYAFQFDDLANIVKNFQVRSGTFADLFLANIQRRYP